MAKENEKIDIIDTEIKEKIGFASLVYNQLYIINIAFNNEDKYKVKAALHTFFDNISPYLDKQVGNRLIKKIDGLDDINDKDEFFREAHKIHRKLLKILKKRKMLFKEVPVSMG